MNISDIFYIILIWPVRFIFEFLFLLFREIFDKNTGISIIFISVFINIILLPVYNTAEKWQKHERLLLVHMKPMLNRIRNYYLKIPKH